MLQHLQKLNAHTENAVRQARLTVGSVLFKANLALILGLALIPTLSGVALIA